MIHPSKKNHKIPAKTKWIIAINNLPCNSYPNPGIIKLAIAAITFPVDPCPDILVAPNLLLYSHISN